MLALDVADLLLLDAHAGGAVTADIADIVHSGHEPELVVRRERSRGSNFSTWFVGIRAAEPGEEPVVEHEVADARVIASLAQVWLGDLRRDVLEELRRRLERERGRG